VSTGWSAIGYAAHRRRDQCLAQRRRRELRQAPELLFGSFVTLLNRLFLDDRKIQIA
jgi:hypothetical protein